MQGEKYGAWIDLFFQRKESPQWGFRAQVINLSMKRSLKFTKGEQIRKRNIKLKFMKGSGANNASDMSLSSNKLVREQFGYTP